MIKTIFLRVDINVPKHVFKKITTEGLKNSLREFLEDEVIWFGSNEENQIGMEIKEIK